jgi:chromosome segregation protein
MYLKRIELLGFKSFTTKTAISFEPGISCIVGPNGSGKSNIADALRWVLGEQNARSIRGGKLEDVIFSGTEKRRALGMAEVSIILDNSDNYLPFTLSEVSVTRRTVRGGGSEYLINNQPCRLKDIHDLFLDTGIGVEGLSLINQNRISELINARPDERRALVEDAAGIVKYRERKREAVRKLIETEQHLETIGAVIGELSSRIEPLAAQAEIARRYLALKEEADKMEIGISVSVLSEAEDKIAALDESLSSVDQRLLREESDKLTLSAEVEALRLSISERDESVAVSSRDYYQLQTQREKAEGELKLLRSRKANTDENAERLTRELSSLETAIAAKQEEISSLTVHVERTAAEIAAAEESILHGEGGESDIRSQLNLLNERLEDLRHELNAATAAETSLAGRLDFKRQLATRNQETLGRLEAERCELTREATAAAADADSYLSRERELKAEAQHQIAVANENELKVRQLNGRMQDAAAEEASCRYQVTSARTRVTMLEEMAAGYEGFFPGVKGLMAARREGNAPAGIIGVVSELIEVPEAYRVAVEAYLGANIQNVVTENGSSAKAAVAYLKEHDLGRATFLPLDLLQLREPADITAALSIRGVHGLMADQVDCDKKIRPAVNFLLNSALLAENMTVAMAAAKALRYRLSVVTLDGDMVNPGASISGGSRNKKNSGLLDKKVQLGEAKNELARLEQDLAKHEAILQGLREEISENNNNHAEARERLRSLNQQLSETTQAVQQLTFAKEARDKRLAAIAAEQSALNGESVSLSSELKSLEHEHMLAATEKATLATEIESTGAEVEMLQQQMSGHQDQLTRRKVSLASSRQKYHGQNLTLTRLTDDLNNLAWEAEDKNADRESALAEAAAYAQQITAAEESLTNTGQALRDAGAELEQLRHGLAAESGRLMELEREEAERTRRREELSNESHQLALRRERWQADFENEAAKLAERFEMDLTVARERAGEIGSRSAMTSRLNLLKREIAALGEVNVATIAEYAEVSGRYNFLSEQREDMLNARHKLDQVIAEMDKIMASRFEAAYAQLSEAFNHSFTRLFGGGNAALYLTEPTDMLETGVEIRVNPPGKKMANYNLLSGGEKALVGIALMFAMLEVRPTPFCVMDEVDAALDEANISRFTDYLMTKASSSQFVMITHRQTTMEAASVLWGVAMEEEGVSKVVSVRLDGVEDQSA